MTNAHLDMALNTRFYDHKQIRLLVFELWKSNQLTMDNVVELAVVAYDKGLEDEQEGYQ